LTLLVSNATSASVGAIEIERVNWLIHIGFIVKETYSLPTDEKPNPGKYSFIGNAQPAEKIIDNQFQPGAIKPVASDADFKQGAWSGVAAVVYERAVPD
jgi:hypothetical protein